MLRVITFFSITGCAVDETSKKVANENLNY